MLYNRQQGSQRFGGIMRILILGGTVFLGRALVEAALAAGHEVTLFNRGKSAPDAFPALETILGDRETDLDRLAGRRWDAVIDTCGYQPRIVEKSAKALRELAAHYTFISTLSVYPPAGAPARDEAAAVLPMPASAGDAVSAETYGPLKALCEAAVLAAFPTSSLLIRSGLIVGPYDPSNRFTYWVTRIARGGDVIAPPPEQPIQFIDARDLAAFTLRQIEMRATGVLNVTGPAQRLSFRAFLPQVKAALASDARLYHVSDGFLRAQGIGEFLELPLWVNRELAEGFLTFSIERALTHGLRFRPLAETIRDTYAWAKDCPAAADKVADLPIEKESALLAAWQAQPAQA